MLVDEEERGGDIVGTDSSPLMKLGVLVSLSWSNAGNPSSAGSFMSMGIILVLLGLHFAAGAIMMTVVRLQRVLMLGLETRLRIDRIVLLGTDFRFNVGMCIDVCYCIYLKELYRYKILSPISTTGTFTVGRCVENLSHGSDQANVRI